MSGLTNQEIFDECAAHVIKQGRPAFDQRRGTCAYWTEEGLSCAIGGPLAARKLVPPCNLSVANINDNANGWTMAAMEAMELCFALMMWGIEEEQLLLLVGIQQSHDYAAQDAYSFIADFKQRMRGVAGDFHLNDAVLGEHP